MTFNGRYKLEFIVLCLKKQKKKNRSSPNTATHCMYCSTKTKFCVVHINHNNQYQLCSLYLTISTGVRPKFIDLGVDSPLSLPPACLFLLKWNLNEKGLGLGGFNLSLKVIYIYYGVWLKHGSLKRVTFGKLIQNKRDDDI